VRYTDEQDAEKARSIVGLAMELAKAGLSEGIPRVIISRATRTEKGPMKQLTKSSVHELGDLKATSSGAEAWMLDVAAMYRRAPVVVAQAMQPFQEAARRGTTAAMTKMAEEVTRMYNCTEQTGKEVRNIKDGQEKIAETMREMMDLLIEMREERRDQESEMAADDNYYTQPARKTQAMNTTKKPEKRLRKARDDEEDEDENDDDQRAAAALFEDLAKKMSSTKEGRTALKAMAEADQTGKAMKFMKNSGLLK